MTQRTVLGPQRPTINLGAAAATVQEGPIATISAAWQEAEGDIDDVREAVGRPLVDLELYRRAERLLAADTNLQAAYRARQDRLIELQRLYRQRLRQLMIAARNMLRAEGDKTLIDAELRHAVSQLRALDRHHLLRIQAIFEEFETTFGPQAYAPVAEQAAEIEKVLANHATVLITGGNVAVLLNRLRLFGVGRMIADKELIAWSAGAMVLANRIVLFHDRTPQGRRDPELLGPGLGILPGYIFMPDATRRLRQDDQIRVGMTTRRFRPECCVALDSGALLRFDERRLITSDNARRLAKNGRLMKLRAR